MPTPCLAAAINASAVDQPLLTIALITRPGNIPRYWTSGGLQRGSIEIIDSLVGFMLSGAVYKNRVYVVIVVRVKVIVLKLATRSNAGQHNLRIF
jgi:hypothetical protein